MGIVPFQLLYSRAPEGPLSDFEIILNGTNKEAKLDTMPNHEYLNKFKGRLERATNEAKLPSKVQQCTMPYQSNLRSKEKNV